MPEYEMWDYLSEVSANYDYTLDLKRRMGITEDGDKNQIVHEADDETEEVVQLSDSSIFYVMLRVSLLKPDESGTIYDLWHNSNKANGRARSWYWVHYGERTDQHTYTVKFASSIPRSMDGLIHGIESIRLKILGRAPS